MPSPPIEAVIFDYGGVLSSSPFDRMVDYEASLGLTPGTLTELLGFGIGVPEPVPGQPSENKFHLLEIGAIELAEYTDWVRTRSGAVFGTAVDLTSRMGSGLGDLGVHWMMIHEVRRLREAGYKLAICTNNIAAYRSTWQDQVPLDLFDEVVDSSEVGVRKPDPEIYRITCERLGVDPTACVFLDDHPGNVDAAITVGMVGVVVADPWDALAELQTILSEQAPSASARTERGS